MTIESQPKLGKIPLWRSREEAPGRVFVIESSTDYTMVGEITNVTRGKIASPDRIEITRSTYDDYGTMTNTRGVASLVGPEINEHELTSGLRHYMWHE